MEILGRGRCLWKRGSGGKRRAAMISRSVLVRMAVLDRRCFFFHRLEELGWRLADLLLLWNTYKLRGEGARKPAPVLMIDVKLHARCGMGLVTRDVAVQCGCAGSSVCGIDLHSPEPADEPV
jgi:hypothetical protein